jgi:hypothetical protein
MLPALAKAQQEPVPPCYASVDWSSSVLDCVAHEAISYTPGLFRPLANEMSGEFRFRFAEGTIRFSSSCCSIFMLMM